LIIEEELFMSDLEMRLTNFVEMLIGAATQSGVVHEGPVTTTGPSPYRRLDCDGRALAYIRVRPKKRGVRVDLSGLWCTPDLTRLRVIGAGGCASLLLRSAQDVREAVSYLHLTVESTRGTFSARSIPDS
jgi:hypothetical protein